MVLTILFSAHHQTFTPLLLAREAASVLTAESPSDVLLDTPHPAAPLTPAMSNAEASAHIVLAATRVLATPAPTMLAAEATALLYLRAPGELALLRSMSIAIAATMGLSSAAFLLASLTAPMRYTVMRWPSRTLWTPLRLTTASPAVSNA